MVRIPKMLLETISVFICLCLGVGIVFYLIAFVDLWRHANGN